MSAAGFWRRTLAFLIDILCLVAIGFAIGTLFRPFLIHLGFNGIFVGFATSLLYFAIGDSRFCDGQTLGKKILFLKIVNHKCVPISFRKALMRTLYFQLPLWILTIAYMQDELIQHLLSWPLIPIVILFVSLYFYIFNRKTRQPLHDLLANTFVVISKVEKVARHSIWFGHAIAVVFIFVGTIPCVEYIQSYYHAKTNTDVELALARQHLLNSEDFFDANLDFYQHIITTVDGPVSVEGLRVIVNTDENDYLDQDKMQLIADKIRGVCDSCSKSDFINIILNYGYNIGIWSQYTGYGYVFENESGKLEF